ncbi:TonB-dependent receptor [Bosea sp. Root670]|uniref:TonB-dependent receptor n=1 Tax=Bosea sp. Root670 TaxID=1736583 RepID=UPI000A83FF77|nr:TonB-dependent receptor [Bosea sp. Root670]
MRLTAKEVLLAATFLSSLGASLAIPVATAQAQTLHSFDIPAKPVRAAMNDIVRVTGVDVVFAETPAASRRGNAVKGSLSTAQAVAALLNGTGLAFRFSNATTVQIYDPARPVAAGGAVEGAIALDTIEVVGSGVPGLPPAYAGGQVAVGGGLGVLGQRSVMDTPFSVTNYTSKLIEDQRAQSVADVVKNDSSIRNVEPTNVGNANYFVIRGIQVGNAAVAFGGLFGIAPNAQSTLAGIERVEVLKGPGAFLGGLSPSGVGGVINLVPKRATDEPLTRFTATWISNSQLGGHLDLGRRFGDQKQFGVRANLLYRDGGTPISQQSQNLVNGTIGLDYRSDAFRISLDAGYQVLNTDRMNNTVTPLATELVPRPIKPNKTYVSPWNYSKFADSYGMVQAEYDVTSNITVYGKAGVSHMDWDQAVEAGSGLRRNGNFTSTGSRYQIDINRYSGEAGVRGRFQTGPLDHEVVISANSFYQARASGLPATLSVTPSNIYNPTFSPNPVMPAARRYRQNDNSFTSYSISDTISAFDKRLQLTLGVRKQFVDINNYTLQTGVISSKNKSDAVTPVIGLVVKPLENVSLYASYIEGLTAGSVVGNTFVNAGQVLPPFVTKQYEAGAKVDWGRLMTSVAVFQSEQASGIANTVTNTFSDNGETRYRGVELSVAGEIVEGVRALGGITFLDSKLVRTANGTFDGNEAQGTPRVQANLGLEWDPGFVRNLTLFGRMIYTGSSYADAANLQKLKAWTTFDIGARYKIERAGAKPIILQANVTNLFNKAYWTTYPGFNLLYPSEARMVSLSSTFEF